MRITFSTFIKAVSLLFGTVLAKIKLKVEKIYAGGRAAPSARLPF